MKKTLILFTLVFLTTFLFANGQEEAGTPSYNLSVMSSGMLKFPEAELSYRDRPGVIEQLCYDFMQDHPNVTIDNIYRDVSKGSLTFDNLKAAGTPPDIWIDATGYFAELLNEDYSIPLEQYMDVSKFQEDLVEQFTVDGHVYGLPLANIAKGFAINVSMLDEIGYTMPPVEEWTTDEYLRLCQRLLDAGHMPTYVQGDEGGLNGWTDAWFYAHGAAMFAPGDWSRVTINSPEALDALAFMQELIDRGFTPDPVTVDDDLAVEHFTTGKLFSSTMQNGHTDYWFPQQLKEGKIDAIPKYTFVEHPHAPGLDHTPVSGYQTMMAAHTSGDPAKDAIIAALLEKIIGEEAQYYYAIVSGGFPTIKGLKADVGAAALPSYQAIANLAATAGYYQQWPNKPVKNELNRIWRAYSEQWLRGKMSPEEFLSKYEAEANAILAAQ